MSDISLHEIKPREQAGRDSIARFRAQFRAAAYFCLEILKGEEVDAVFCDLHEDYVVRRKFGIGFKYDFYQVKTKDKKGFQWGLDEVFGVKSKKPQSPASIRESFAGKLMMSAINFGENCFAINLQSNKDFSEAVYLVEEALKIGDINQVNAKHLFLLFKEAYPVAVNLTDDQIKNRLSRFRLLGGSAIVDIEAASFSALTRQAILDYSEIDLSPIEFEEVLLKLLSLVEGKSAGKIEQFDEQSIGKKSGVFLDDVLGVMAISSTGYKYIRDGGDAKALKSVSIIQRVLKNAGAQPELVEFCCKCKSEYDIWFANTRHYIDSYEYQQFRQEVNEKISAWVSKDGNLNNLLTLSKTYNGTMNYKFSDSLDDEKCLGAFFSELVRLKA